MACHLGNRLAGEDEYPGFSSVPVAREQHGVCLALQRGDGDLLESFLPGNGNGSIQTPQVHICRHDEGHPLKESVPGRIL